MSSYRVGYRFYKGHAVFYDRVEAPDGLTAMAQLRLKQEVEAGFQPEIVDCQLIKELDAT